MKKILITGADGFIGSHLTEFCVRMGYDVRALVMYNSFGSCGWLDNCAEDVKGNFEILHGDIRDFNSVSKAMTNCDIIFHLAALVAIPYSYQAVESYLDTNIKGTLNMLQAATNLGVSRFIHTSTSEVYGTAKFVPITEQHPLQGQSPYAATKIAADQLAYSFYSSFDLPLSIVRPFNTYGPRQSARAVLPAIISQIAGGINKISLGSLHPTRDFNYISDTINGFLAVAKAESTIGEVLNIGSGYEISIGDAVALVADIMQKNINIDFDEQRSRPQKSEVERLLADNTKALKLCGWSPKYTGSEGLREGLTKTIAWFIQPENIKLYNLNKYVI